MDKKKIAMIICIVLVVILLGIVCIGNIIKVAYKRENPIATITVEGYEEPIVVELYPEYALNTVKNFITLANNGFYDNLKIHRVEDYVIQGGDPNGDGTGGPKLSDIDPEIEKDSEEDKDYTIVGEFKSNGYDNPIVHEKGVISMARSNYGTSDPELAAGSYNSAGSQFFLCTKYMQGWNGQYAAFGKVTKGIEIVDAIASVDTNYYDMPLNKVVIKSIKIEE